jgi:hypothetical protein
MAVAANCAWVEPLVRESQEDIEDNRGDGEEMVEERAGVSRILRDRILFLAA